MMNALPRIERTDTFARNLRRLEKKHKGLAAAINGVLEELGASDPPPTKQIPGLDGSPVFKQRVAVDNRGQRGGVRIIYHQTDECLTALFIYSKADKESVPTKEIANALKSVGLIDGNNSLPKKARPPTDPG